MEFESEKLRNQINNLKNESYGQSNNESLAKSINTLIGLFAEASEDMKMDTHDAVLVTQKLDKIIERLDKVEIQNEKIAKGIVALADMVEEINSGSAVLPRQTNFRPTQAPPMRQVSPPPASRSSFGARPLPSYDLPPQEEKKKAFLNFKM